MTHAIVNNNVWVSCHGKHQFPTHKLAAEALNRKRDIKARNVYRCTKCGLWHIGNSMPKTKNDKKQKDKYVRRTNVDYLEEVD